MIRSYLIGVVLVESLKVKTLTMDSQPVIYVESHKTDTESVTHQLPVLCLDSQVLVDVRPSRCRCCHLLVIAEM